ncbi:hypothetical protein JKI95_07790 [Corynebacterium aquatimens]|uniref:hypothetical protein n=1 Tax=Corynebacterium TaxID=1716 RepID=UPI001F3C34CF|nr:MULTISPECIES: hypothetical protein [Corynebacterium]QYH19139.1 hypothetical protein JKI95_07790 [Corynebacterium aquatimens]UIZ91991.1 hypothetical protein JZY91_09980 [Corynebacterium sp. CNCTC7651]
MTNPNTPNNSEGLYTDAAGLNATDSANTANTEAKASSCGCGHHKPVETTQVREEIKIVPADHATNTGASCGCEPGHCRCGHHQTCDCAPGECKCGHNHGLQDNADAAAAHAEASSCGCGHHHEAPTAVPAEETPASTNNTTAETAPAGCCGGHGHHGMTEEEYLDPDKTDANNIDPAVKTVEPAAGHNEGTEWNDGILPTETGEATESGAGQSEDGQIN